MKNKQCESRKITHTQVFAQCFYVHPWQQLLIFCSIACYHYEFDYVRLIEYGLLNLESSSIAKFNPTQTGGQRARGYILCCIFGKTLARFA